MGGGLIAGVVLGCTRIFNNKYKRLIGIYGAGEHFNARTVTQCMACSSSTQALRCASQTLCNVNMPSRLLLFWRWPSCKHVLWAWLSHASLC
jgi:hypothetical protein